MNIDGREPGSHPILRVGCPMWAHAPWIGRFLSPGNRGRELAEYARWCNAVEGNTTFYATPTQATIARWAEQAPADFRFMFKLPRTVTHELRLHGGARVHTAEFLRAIDPLGDRVGPIQIQLPPSFGPDALTTLGRFVRGLPTDRRWVIELRHRAFFDEGPAHLAVDEMLERADVGRVVLDTRPLHATPPLSEASIGERSSKPKLPIVTSRMGDAPIVRVIGADDPQTTYDGLATWIPRLVAWIGEGCEPYLFVHQPENLDAPALARHIHDAVAAEIPGLRPLPEPLPVAPAGEITGQSSLF